MTSVNFEFLRPGNDLLVKLAGLAEAVLHIDPGSTLTRLRSFAEELTKTIYKEETLPRQPQASFYTFGVYVRIRSGSDEHFI